MTRTLRSDGRLPLHVRVGDDLVDRIAAGEWSPRTPLPPERSLAEEYGISVGTMRKVLSDLVAAGRLVREQGRGTYVRHADFSTSFLRFLRHGDPSGPLPTGHVLERTVTTAEAPVAEALHLPSGAPIVRLHRERRLGDRVLALEDIALPADRFSPLADLPVEDFADLLYPQYEELCAQTVTTASEVMTISTATADEARALGVDRDAPLVRIERLARDVRGDALEHRISRTPAAGFTYRMEIQ